MDEQQEEKAQGLPGTTDVQPVAAHSGPEEDPRIELDKILEGLYDCPGYVVFVGKIKSKDGNLQLDSFYRRYHMNLEDLIEVYKFINRTIENEGLNTRSLVHQSGG